MVLTVSTTGKLTTGKPESSSLPNAYRLTNCSQYSKMGKFFGKANFNSVTLSAVHQHL